MSSCLRPIDQDVWVADQPFRLLGAEYGTRMTVVRLPDSSLWIHSPVLAAASMRAELDALGRVEHIVAPNCFHHLKKRRPV